MWLFLIQESSSSFFIAWWLASPEQMRGATGLVKARNCLLLVKASHAASPHSRGGNLDSTSSWIEWHGHTGREGISEGRLWSLFTMLSPGTPQYLEDKKMRRFRQRMWRSDPEVREGQALGTLTFTRLHSLYVEIIIYFPCCFPTWTRPKPEVLFRVAAVWGQVKNGGGWRVLTLQVGISSQSSI